MKNITSIILLIISNTTFAQNCNIGNQNAAGFNLIIPFQNNYLLGVMFNLNTNGLLTSLNLIGNNTGAQVQLAMYEDNGGVPGNLVVSSDSTNVGAGIISLPVTPTQLITGNYWIMGIYNDLGIHTYNKNSSGNPIYYLPLTFGDTIPINGSNFLNYTGVDFTYFAQITCSPLGISDAAQFANISFYPNPASDYLKIYSDKNLIGSTYIITDLLGKQVMAGKLNSETFSIDISQINSGVYLFQIGQLRNKILKLIRD